MKKTLLGIAAILATVLVNYSYVSAVNITVPSAPSSGYGLVSTTTGAYNFALYQATYPLSVTANSSGINYSLLNMATTTVSCSGTVSCTSFTVIGSSPVTIIGSAGGTSVGTIATSSPDTVGQILYYTTTNGYPARTAGVATSTLTPSSPLTGSFIQIGSNGSLGCQTASGSQAGCLSSMDWTTFNNKGSGTITSVGATYPLSSTGGITPVISSATSSASSAGILSAADWTTFNGKQTAGSYITALTGDITASGPGSVAATLATVNSNIGSFTNANITVNGKGLITAAANGSGGSGTVTSVTLASPNSTFSLSGTNPVTTSGTINADLNLGHSNFWTATQNFTNASTSEFTATSTVWFTSLGTPTGTFLAVDPNGKVIATSTPSGSNSAFSPAANYATTGTLPAYTYVAGVITEVSNGALSVDGANPSVGQIVLVKNETGACTSSSGGCNNGLYNVTAAGSGIAAFVLTRNSQYNSSSNVIPGIITYVISGTVNNDDFYAMTSAAPITIGTTALNYTEVSGGGANVTSVSNSDNTLTISPTAGAVVASLNLAHANTWSALQLSSAAGTTTFAGGLYASQIAAPYFNATSSTATSTFANGINLSNGCFAVNGTCISSGSGVTGSGVVGQVSFWSGTNSITGNSNFTWNTGSSALTVGNIISSNNITGEGWARIGFDYQATTPPTNGMIVEGQGGIGTTTPWGMLAASSTSIYPTFSVEQHGTGLVADFLGGVVNITNASTTNLTVGTFLAIPSNSNPSPLLAGQLIMSTNTPYQLQIGNGNAGTAVFDPRWHLTLSFATSTTWTGTTTVPVFTFPQGGTIQSISCTIQPSGATLDAQLQYANSSAYTTVNTKMVPASTTPGVYPLSSSNTPTVNATSTLSIGTPAGSPTNGSCTLIGVWSGI